MPNRLTSVVINNSLTRYLLLSVIIKLDDITTCLHYDKMFKIAAAISNII